MSLGSGLELGWPRTEDGLTLNQWQDRSQIHGRHGNNDGFGLVLKLEVGFRSWSTD